MPSYSTRTHIRELLSLGPKSPNERSSEHREADEEDLSAARSQALGADYEKGLSRGKRRKETLRRAEKLAPTGVSFSM